MNLGISHAGQLRSGALVTAAILAVLPSCSTGDVKAGLGPNESSPITEIRVSPPAATVEAGGTVAFVASATHQDGSSSAPSVVWTASGGSISAGGLYTAPGTVGSYRVVATEPASSLADSATITITSAQLVGLTLTPATVSLPTGGVAQFGVAGQWSDGSTATPAVSYTATGGTITPGGRYTAGATAGTYRVIATQQGGTLADTSAVTISAPVLEAVILTPSAVALSTGATQQFTVAGQWSNGATTPPAVTYSATGGTITSGGLYTAGSTAGSFRVIATQQGGGLADTSVVTLTVPVLEAVILTPASVSLFTGNTLQFTVAGQWSNGATTPPPVTFTATGGSINATGLYTAGGSSGVYRVIAVHQGGTLADTASITISPAPPPSMFFNSAEAGCGTDPNVLLCDDFEDGDWYTKDCDQANQSGGLLQTDGWCGSIYANPITPAGAVRAGGVRGTSFAATHGVTNGGAGGRNMADHSLAQSTSEVWIRYYVRPLAGYMFGAEKFLSLNRDPAGAGGIYWGNLHLNMGAGSRSSTGELFWQVPGSPDVSRALNFSLRGDGHWYFIELHIKLSTSRTSGDGILEFWADDVGLDGTGGPATPTLRYRVTNFNFPRNSPSDLIASLWFENWANPGSIGEMYLDQIVVSKSGPVGFMQ